MQIFSYKVDGGHKELDMTGHEHTSEPSKHSTEVLFIYLKFFPTLANRNTDFQPHELW